MIRFLFHHHLLLLLLLWLLGIAICEMGEIGEIGEIGDHHPYSSSSSSFSFSSPRFAPLSLGLAVVAAAVPSCPYGYLNTTGDCKSPDPCVWSSTNAVCSVTGVTNVASAVGLFVEGPASSAQFNSLTGLIGASPTPVAAANRMLLYVTDWGCPGAVRIVDVFNRTVRTLAASADLCNPFFLARFDPVSNVNPLYPHHVLVANYDGYTIVSVNLISPYEVTVICGKTGAQGIVDGSCNPSSGVARFKGPSSIAVHSSGMWALVSDLRGCNIRLLNLTTTPHTVRLVAGSSAGTCSWANSATSGPAASFMSPVTVILDPIRTQYAYVADYDNKEIRRLTLGQVSGGEFGVTAVSTLAGDHTKCCGIVLNSIGTSAQLNGLESCALDFDSHYLYCTLEHSLVRIDLVDSNHAVTALTFATTATGATDFTNGLDSRVRFNYPDQPDIVVDPVSKRWILFVADNVNNKVRSVVLTPRVPLAPMVSAQSLSDGRVNVSVAIGVGGEGGDAITNCTAISSPGNFTLSVSVRVPAGTVGPIASVVFSLPPAVYTFQASCSNSLGPSSLSASSSSSVVTAAMVAPTIGSVIQVSNSSARVNFRVGSGYGSAVTNCSVSASPGGSVAVLAAADALGGALIELSWQQVEVRPLSVSVSYQFSVVCSTLEGTGAVSALSNPLLIRTPPSAPTALNVTLVSTSSLVNLNSNATARVFVQLPSSNGADLLNCTVMAFPVFVAPSRSISSPSSTQVQVASAAVTVSQTLTASPNVTLATGTVISVKLSGLRVAQPYRISVQCWNEMGAGPISNELNFVAPLPPDAPFAVSVSAITTTARSVTVWFLPGSSNGSPILYCTAESFPGGVAVNTSSSLSVESQLAANGEVSVVLSGLSGSVAYRFQVTCTNTMGTSSPSHRVSYCKRCCRTSGDEPVALRC